MFEFENPQYFWLLPLAFVPLLLYFLYYSWRSRKQALLGNSQNLKYLLRGGIKGRLLARSILLSVLLFILFLSLVNLRKGSGSESTERKGLDVVIALDVSKSMLAKDMSPNRLERSKLLIRQMLAKMGNDRVGLVVFAGKAYLQSPITIDYSALQMVLSAVDPDMIPTQGTVLNEAIVLATKSFNNQEKKYKALILISDGEDHDENAISAANAARKEGVAIYTIGVGSAEGGQILDAHGQAKTDEQGNVVVTKLNEQELIDIAKAGGGTYQRLYNPQKVAADLVANLNGLEQKKQGSVVFAEYKSYFQWLVGLGIVLLLLDALLPTAKKYSSILKSFTK